MNIWTVILILFDNVYDCQLTDLGANIPILESLTMGHEKCGIIIRCQRLQVIV